MCGIAGVLGGERGMELALRMSACVAHRGPDDAGASILRGRGGAAVGAFAHRRLAILDPSAAGHQPMSGAGGRFELAFNGEIYNFREVRRELERSGIGFRSGSDTEVLLAAWAAQGPDCLLRMRGMFAFALWDRETSRLFLVRDPFGIKPLFFAEIPGALLFASEVRALLATGDVATTIDAAAVAGYLGAGSVAEPRSIIREVRAVPAGATLCIELDDRGGYTIAESRVDPFAALAREAREQDPERAESLVLEALRDSVTHHLVSDVPVAVFLSGGIDSSVVASLAAEVAPSPPEMFTVTFDEHAYSEASFARVMAARLGARHHEIRIKGSDLLGALPDALGAMDQPSLDGLNTYVVSRAVRAQGIKVVLSGLGGDEMFAGYPSFRRAALISRWGAMPGPVRDAVGGLARRVAGRAGHKLATALAGGDAARAAYVASRTLFAPSTAAMLAPGGVADPLPQPPAGLSLLQRVSWYESSLYMRNTLLRDADVFSMSHGLELRVPFVDREVLGAALRTADAHKLRRGTSKPLLVRALGTRLPREVWDRPKQGFQLPFDDWLRGDLRAEVERTFSGDRVARVGLAPHAVRQVWRGYLDRRGVTWSRPWALFALVRWAELTGASIDSSRSTVADLAIA